MPTIGHLDPEYLVVMDELQELLRFVFQTKNELTLSISGTGSASMEAALCNFIEPGDKVLVLVIGYFGERLCDMAARYGAVVDRIERPWGEVVDPDEVSSALKEGKYKMVALVHAETSTGARQPDVDTISRAAHDQGALVVMDTVTSLGGLPVKIDDWGVDIAYSGAQKSLSSPPGVAPLTVSERAREVMVERKTQVANFYLDLNSLEKYWGEARAYHHTAPTNLNFALREALRLVVEEGLEPRYARHQSNAEYLWAGLEDMGFKLLVPEAIRLPTLTTPVLPPEVEDAEVRQRLLEDYNIEIAGGFGPLKGKIWRIGLMGYSSRRENITLLLSALREILV
jgi:alanine-glyoxylate transaminase/serine-glyoxylate transaminase/serine-pyruvate transaminase